MAMPHLVFKRKCISELKNLEGREKLRKIEELLSEMSGYNTGPYGEIRKWLNSLITKTRNVSKGKSREYFAIKKLGDLQVAFIGKPSAGKSSLISKLSSKDLKIGAYDFTTIKPDASTIIYRGLHIQLVDLPGLIEDASIGKGLGKQIISASRSADLFILVHDLTKELKSSLIVINELEKAAVNIKDKLIIAANKLDLVNDNYSKTNLQLQLNSFDKDFKDVKVVYVSTIKDIGLTELKDAIVEKSGYIIVYSATDNCEIPIAKGSTIKDFCNIIHKDFEKEFNYAKVTGKSARFLGQQVGLNHVLEDGDKIEIIKHR
ncbi:MAG: GTPase [archaeon]